MGYRAALVSPHEKYLAVDLDTTSAKESKNNAEVVQQIAKTLGLKVRVGWKKYLSNGQTFIHIDVAPMYYAKGCVWHNENHPVQWENEIVW